MIQLQLKRDVVLLVVTAFAFGLTATGRQGLVYAQSPIAEAAHSRGVRVDFGESVRGLLPPNFAAVAVSGKGTTKFRIGESGGRGVLTDEPERDGEGDVLFYKAAPMRSIEESYSFIYSGAGSVVEPFIVLAHPKRPDAVHGFTTDLAASHPDYNSAGNVKYRYVDDTGKVYYAIRGRLRTEPYFYTVGHVYRVDAIVDGVSGLLTTRVYDVALGPQTFDVNSASKISKGFDAYPGIVARFGRVAVEDFEFGTVGKLPISPHPARRAADYLNYLGYNAAVIGPATSPISLAFQRYFPQLLIKHVRVPDQGRFLPSLNAVARYGIDADVLTSNKTTLDHLRTFVADLALPPDSIELWNEPNNWGQGAAYDRDYAINLPPFATQVAGTFPRVKLWGPSVISSRGDSRDVDKLSPVGPTISAWNAHSYTHGAPENLGYGTFISHACGVSKREDCGWYGAANANDNLSAIINPSLPGVTTEGAASYGSYPDICGHSNVDAPTQQAYVERGMLYNFKLGHLRIYPYKFIDDGGCSDGFGTFGIMSKLIDANGEPTIVPKPTYVSLVYFDHIISDAGAQAKTFDAKPLAYTVSGGQPDVEELLLAESDGSYRLILWSDAALWDFNVNGLRAAGSEVPLVSEHVDLTFEKAMRTTVYTQTPGTGSWSAGNPARSTSIGVTVNQYPLVVSIAANSEVDHAIALPRGVPTPGPLETPRPVQMKLPQ